MLLFYTAALLKHTLLVNTKMAEDQSLVQPDSAEPTEVYEAPPFFLHPCQYQHARKNQNERAECDYNDSGDQDSRFPSPEDCSPASHWPTQTSQPDTTLLTLTTAPPS